MSRRAATDSKNGGRNTLNPDAAARLIPIRVAMITAVASMYSRPRGSILTQTRPQSPISTSVAPISTRSPTE